ncbi:MAG: UMP kinase [Vampirovibrionales bacterium]|jgi:uridylate kinase|nr:UMP kinase [Vampirovibrionales bacterium]
MTTTPRFKRILLKISGEALMGDQGFGIKPEVVGKICEEVKQAHELGVDIAIVVGGGNIFRGVQNSTKLGMDRAAADYVGMTATIMNALVLQGVLQNKKVENRMMTAIGMDRVAEPYIRKRAIRHLEKGRVVVFGGGTGNPFFSTDTTSALRAAEINAEVILMAKNGVDGVYDKDPKTNADAVKFDRLTYDEVLRRNLKVMDQTAISLCKETKLPIICFDFNAENAISGLLQGQTLGTIIASEDWQG